MDHIMTSPAAENSQPVGTWAQLKTATKPVHERLDTRIMQARPFDSLDRYGQFLLVQHDFHVRVSPLYQRDDLAQILPDLKARDRLPRIEQDLADLKMDVPSQPSPIPALEPTIPEALGWLYVAEGSNLGAAFLLKAAQKLGLSEDFGARHLAAAAEGRGLHWKTFTAALDAIALGLDEQTQLITAAERAFDSVRNAVEARFSALTEA